MMATPSEIPARAEARCELCGLPVHGVPADSVEAPVFCCPGCATVHDVFSGDGSGNERAGLIVRFAAAGFLAFNVMVFSMALYGDRVYGEAHGFAPEAVANFFRWVVMGLSLPAVWLLGGPQVRAVLAAGGWSSKAFHGLLLVSVGAALAISMWSVATGEGEIYFDTAVALLLLATLGRLLEGWMRSRAVESLEALLGSSKKWLVRRPGEEGELELVEGDILAGDGFDLRAGDRAPVDAEIVRGGSEFSSESIDGELRPMFRAEGSRVRSGELNIGDPVGVRALPGGGEPFWARYRTLLREALDKPARAERIASRMAAILLPLATALATGAFAFWWWRLGEPAPALMVALSVLAVACPCAMALATPLALRLAMAEAGRMGALPSSTGALEVLARVDHFVIDNTGTLTEAELEVAAVSRPEGADPLDAQAREALLALARQSSHPVAEAVRRWAERSLAESAPSLPALRDVREAKGLGLSARLADGEGAEIVLGSRRWLEESGVSWPADWPAEASGFAWNGQAVAAFELDAPLRPDSGRCLEELFAMGLGVSLMTGAAELPALPEGLVERCALAASGRTPADKVARIGELQAAGLRVAMVGDGLNDLPAIAAADSGIAVGGAREAVASVADLSLPAGGLGALPALVRLARKARRVVRRNFAWALGYNSIALGAAVSGHLHPLIAAILMAASSAAIVGQSFTLLTPPPFKRSPEESADAWPAEAFPKAAASAE